MKVSRDVALKLWDDVYPNKEWATDCFGTWMNRGAYSNVEVVLTKPGSDKRYDYSWNVDHIRPSSDYEKESQADFMNNYEPMHRLNNSAKGDSYPHFTVDAKQYLVFSQDNYKGYGIKSVKTGAKIDWKSVQNRYYKK